MSATAVSLAITAANWVVLDLETGDAPEEAIQAAIGAWKAPSNWKAETVAQKRQDTTTRIREKAALLDASPILCCALVTDRGERWILHGMNAMPNFNMDGWTVMTGHDERGLMMLLRAWLNSQTSQETVIVGHNCKGFDLPKLRQAYIRHGIKPPETIRQRQDDEPAMRIADTMQMVKAFSMEYRDERFISLDTTASILGIPKPKQHISGADVPRLHREKRYQEILTYAAIDCATTARAYTLMTSQATDLI